MSTPLYALDIETTHTRVDAGVLRSIAVWSARSHMVASAEELGEIDLILGALAWLRSQPRGVVVGWNSSGFDVPWLIGRAASGGIDLAAEGLIYAVPSEDRPLKYPAVDEHATGWRVEALAGHRHADIALAWRAWCEETATPWSLKPVARAHGLDPLEEDREHMEDLSDERLLAYNLSDVRVTHELARGLGSGLEDWID